MARRKDIYTRRWFQRSPYELSIPARVATFAGLVAICFVVAVMTGAHEPFGRSFLIGLLLIGPVDWIVQGWRESAAAEADAG